MVDIHIKLSALDAEYRRAQKDLSAARDKLTPLLVEEAKQDTAVKLHEQYQAVIAELLLEKKGRRRGELREAVLSAFKEAGTTGLFPRELRSQLGGGINSQIKRLSEAGTLMKTPAGRWRLADLSR